MKPTSATASKQTAKPAPGTIAYSERTAKLTANDVRVVRFYHRAGWKHEKIARAFGVSKAAISHIVTGKSWANVEGMAAPGTEADA